MWKKNLSLLNNYQNLAFDTYIKFDVYIHFFLVVVAEYGKTCIVISGNNFSSNFFQKKTKQRRDLHRKKTATSTHIYKIAHGL